MASLSRRHFIGSLFGAALALEPLLEGCATFSGLNAEKRWQKEISDFTPVTIRLIPFQEYHPASAEKELTLDDRMLETYLTKPYSLNGLDLMIHNAHVVNNPDDNPIKRLNINNYDRFKEEVLAVAQELGYSPEQVSALSVHEAVMLSGKIVANRLKYDDEMIGPEDKVLHDLNSRYRLDYILAKSAKGEDDRTEVAKRIDSSTKDEIFHNGQGICRNYAGVNVIVFNLLKSLNPALTNTTLRYYDPDELGHVLALPHAWNLVSTIVEKSNGLEVQITYVDPTWLDTRNQSAANTGKKVDSSVTDEDIYDALDESHFGKKAIIAQIYLAQLYQTIGKHNRRYSSLFPAPQQTLEEYTHHAYSQRLEVCNLTLDLAEENPTQFDQVDSYFLDSFKEAVENLTACSLNSFLRFGPDLTSLSQEEKQRDEFQQLKVVYQRALSLVPEFLAQENLSHSEYLDHPCSDNPDKTCIKGTTHKISPAELYQKLASQFQPK